jgi:hypothetical protein
MSKIKVQNVEISYQEIDDEVYLSLTDVVKSQDNDQALYGWMKSYSTIQYLGVWEATYNQAGFDEGAMEEILAQVGSNSYGMSPKKWISLTGAKGMFSKAGRGGGTYAHEDIALEFCSWLNPVFKFHVLSEFKRLKNMESKRLQLQWDLRRELARMNYHIQTDSVRQNRVPMMEWHGKSEGIYFAKEADMLNQIVFGMSAKEWKISNPDKKGNLRDFATPEDLHLLANMEALNAEFMEMKLATDERTIRLLEAAKRHLAIIQSRRVKKLR